MNKQIFLAVFLPVCSVLAGDLIVDNVTVIKDATVIGSLNFSGSGTATGGTITTNGNYLIHTFTNVGSTNFVVTGGPLACDVLVVAGGGGGGGGYAYQAYGGGGGGGVTNLTSYQASGSIDVIVGAGGSGGGDGANGSNSTFGGGGGAWTVGANGAVNAAGAGGTGATNSISGSSLVYGGGGGGGFNWNAGAGGSGGGGAGGRMAAGSPGTANTGGGCGGGAADGATAKANGNGGSGIVIVRYAITSSNNATTLSISSNGISQTSASGANVLMGKVGIGTNNPAEKLHVVGNARVDGTNIVAALTLGNVTRTNWPTGNLAASNNLSELANQSTARTNLGLGTASTNNVTAFDTAGAAGAVSNTLSAHINNFNNPHQVTASQVGALTPSGNGSQLTGITSSQVGALAAANNLSDAANIVTARANLGLGSAATNNANDFLSPASNGSQLTGITAAQVGALSATGGVVNGVVNFNGPVSFASQFGDVPMGVFTNR